MHPFMKFQLKKKKKTNENNFERVNIKIVRRM